MSSVVHRTIDVKSRQTKMHKIGEKKLAFTPSNSWQYPTDACQKIGQKYTKIQISSLIKWQKKE